MRSKSFQLGLLVLAFHLLFPALAWSQVADWTAIVDSPEDDYVYAIAPHPWGGCVLTGQSGSALYVWRLDGYGNEVWSFTRPSLYSDVGRAIRCRSDGTILVAGGTSTYSQAPPVSDAFILCLDPSGAELWFTVVGTDETAEQYYSVDQTPAGDVIAGGESRRSSTNSNALASRFTPNGALIWTHEYNYSSDDGYRSTISLSTGEALLLGYNKPSFWRNGIAVKVRPDGSEIWMKGLGSRYGGAALAGTADSSTYSIAWTHTGWSFTTLQIATFDTAGVQASNPISSYRHQHVTAMDDGGFLAVEQNSTNVLLERRSRVGTKLWQHLFEADVSLTPCASMDWGSGMLVAGFGSLSDQGKGILVKRYSTSPPAALPEVLAPTTTDCWLTGTPEPQFFRVAWTLPSSNVDHLTIRYSTDGVSWPMEQILAEGIDAHALGFIDGTANFPEANSSAARVRLECYAADNSFIDYVNSQSFALANNAPIRLAADSEWQLENTPPILKWNDDPTATLYSVTLRPSSSATSCDYYVGGGVPLWWNAEVVPPRSHVVLPADLWLQWPAGEYELEVTTESATSGSSTQILPTFLKANLSNLDPHDTEGKPLVVLLHGWTDDTETWYKDGASTLVDSLINNAGYASERFHPWAFEYPNIGSIQTSAAALGAALGFLGASQQTPASLIAHSMGGLVARTLLQGAAVEPRTGNSVAPPPVGSIVRLATLATPHLGADLVGTGSFLKVVKEGCFGVEESASRSQLPDGSTFMTLLNRQNPGADELPPIQYFFAAGVDGISLYDSNCLLGNDFVVDVCSARGDCDNTHTPQTVPFASGTEVLYGNYDLAHWEMAQPGMGGWFTNRGASDSLLSDLLGFIRCGICFSPATCPAAPQGSSHQFRTQYVPLNGKSSGIHQLAGALESPAIGVTATIVPLGGDPAIEGNAQSTGLLGEVTFNLTPGSYELTLSGNGFQTRQQILDVTPESGDCRYEVTLDPIAEYLGPGAPYVGLLSGGSSSPDSVLHLTLSCTNATEMRIAVPTVGVDTDWISYDNNLNVPVGASAGLCEIVVWYRNGSGIETDPISVLATANVQITGDLQVDSMPPGAAITLDGRATGLITPALLTALDARYHYVTASLAGYQATPGVATVQVHDGQTASTTFSLAPSGEPSQAVWSSPASGVVVGPHVPLRWMQSTDPDLGDVILYDLAAFSDSSLSSRVWTMLGMTGLSINLPAWLPDSSIVYLALTSVDSRGTVQTAPASILPVLFDASSPVVTVLTPGAGDTVGTGVDVAVTLEVGDWSALESLCVVLSHDAGESFPDTIYSGSFLSQFVFVPPSINSSDCVLRADVRDAAGNVGTGLSDSLFTILADVTSADTPHDVLELGMRVSPNPARTEIAVGYELPFPAWVQLSVFDVAGRRVKVLYEGDRPAGVHEARWDGQSSSGASAGQGIYFIQLRAGSTSATRRVLLLD